MMVLMGIRDVPKTGACVSEEGQRWVGLAKVTVESKGAAGVELDGEETREEGLVLSTELVEDKVFLETRGTETLRAVDVVVDADVSVDVRVGGRLRRDHGGDKTEARARSTKKVMGRLKRSLNTKGKARQHRSGARQILSWLRPQVFVMCRPCLYT